MRPEKSIHAEEDLIRRLPFRRSRKLKTIDIVVVQVKKLRYANSRPCASCIHKMQMCAPAKGYVVRRIYYSDKNGEMVKTTLDQLLREPMYHSRGSSFL
jgi:cytidine deaminase